MTPTARTCAAMNARKKGEKAVPRLPAENQSSAAPGSRIASRKPSSRVLVTPEPDLVMLLSDPEIRLLMRADQVEEAQLREMLDARAVQLQASRAAHDATYRPGVGILLLNNRNEVFVGRRIDVEQDAWPMPQGGIESGESPREAALRELREEIGTDDVELLAESTRWLYYDVPEELATKAWDGRWRRQRQRWVAMLFKGQDSDINLATAHPEFNAWRWVRVQELCSLAVSFKRRLYVDLLGEFPTIFRE
jgi:putative (di)nucleoside polyphosphate hydrolase